MAQSETPNLPLSTMVHMVNIKLTSTNYLLWHAQIHPLLASQQFLPLVDGSSLAPPATVTSTNGQPAPNPEFITWTSRDQILKLFLVSTLTEESMSVVIGCNTSRDVWLALSNAYSHGSKARELSIKDDLLSAKKGSKSVAEYGRLFKSLCDQLAAIGRPIDESDKSHWFLRGLGPSFSSFTAAQMAQDPLPDFTTLLNRATSHELFQKGVDDNPPVAAAFTAVRGGGRGRGGSSNNYRGRGGSSGGSSNRGRGRGRKTYPRACFFCRDPDHDVFDCPKRFDKNFDRSCRPPTANIAEAFNTSCNINDSNPSDWYLDTGASAHMATDAALLDSSASYAGSDHVTVGNGEILNISAVGSLRLPSGLLLQDVLVVPGLTKNLLSVSKLTSDSPVSVSFDTHQLRIMNRDTGQIIATGRRSRGLYRLDSPLSALSVVHQNSRLHASFDVWHNRLGHVAPATIKLLQKFGHLSINSILPSPRLCNSCQLAKSTRLSYVANEKRAADILDVVHCDLWGPAPVISDAGFKYYAVFIDDFSRFSWLYPLHAKSELYDVFLRYQKFVETQFSRKIKIFQTDGGGEFVNNKLRTHFSNCGIHHIMSCPHTPAQNGRAERKHRHITETGLAMLFHSSIPMKFWVEAFSTAVYIINRLPSAVIGNTTPFELLYRRPPAYDTFHVFGCRVYPCLRDYVSNKFDHRSRACVFLGYSTQHKGFRCFDPNSSRVYISRHARFDEICFPYASSPRSSTSLQLSEFREIGSSHADHILQPTVSASNRPPPHLIDSDSVTNIEPQPTPPPSPPPASPPPGSPPASPVFPEPPAAPPAVPQRTHQMRTRAQSGIFKPKYPADLAFTNQFPLYCALLAESVPRGIKSALKHSHWVAAMNEEMAALRSNGTWDLVPRPPKTNIVGSKWVFRTKYLADGSVDRHKARLVAQGFSQIPGFDFTHTFSPVVKASTVRIILAIAVMNSWPLHQLDVKNAFLNGHLSSPVYMEQPPGYIDPAYPNHVCRLKKALYGLRQAPLAWYQRFRSFLLDLGFSGTHADTSLFIFSQGSTTIYLLVYVDDIIITGNEPSSLQALISRVRKEFAIKDLGRLSYFLGLEVSYPDAGLFLSQAKYARDILDRANLLDSKPVSTPLAPGVTFTTKGTPFSDPTLYRSLVGALQYLTITRPDLSYSVNTVSQFQQCPTIEHFQAVKRILRYVKGTLGFGLSFTPGPASLIGYSDADWARCIDTRRSMYGYAIFLGPNLVSWSAKKQPTVARSSCESEYRAMANTASEIVWVSTLLQELKFKLPKPPLLLTDSRSALFLTQNPISHKRAKHIAIDYHFARELVERGHLVTRFVPSSLQLADIFTKSLGRPLFQMFRSKLCVSLNPTLRLRGGVSDNYAVD